MTTIVYLGDDKTVSVADPGMTVLDISIAHKIPHLRECGGNARCTTCRVRICDGIQNVSPRTPREAEVADARRWDRFTRLACQARVGGDVTLERLVRRCADVSRLQLDKLPSRRRRSERWRSCSAISVSSRHSWTRPGLRRGAHPQSLLHGDRRCDPGQQRRHPSVCRRSGRRPVRAWRRPPRKELSRQLRAGLGMLQTLGDAQLGAVDRVRRDPRYRRRGPLRAAHRRDDGASSHCSSRPSGTP